VREYLHWRGADVIDVLESTGARWAARLDEGNITVAKDGSAKFQFGVSIEGLDGGDGANEELGHGTKGKAQRAIFLANIARRGSAFGRVVASIHNTRS